MTPDSPYSVAVLNDYPVVIQGVAGLLAGDERLTVVDMSSVVLPGEPVDLALYDAFATRGSPADQLLSLRNDARFDKVVLYTWNLDQPQLDEALAAGARGVVSKQLDGDALADALVRAGQGEVVIEPAEMLEEPRGAAWPGREQGLSAREGEVVALITQGLTNDQIAETCYLSINSVKSYIRSAYRKMGVERRSQAVLWGVRHDMLPQAQSHQPRQQMSTGA